MASVSVAYIMRIQGVPQLFIPWTQHTVYTNHIFIVTRQIRRSLDKQHRVILFQEYILQSADRNKGTLP